ncbi:MAG: PKD domain-containing protein, partial [Phycisphaerae bacterium]
YHVDLTVDIEGYGWTFSDSFDAFVGDVSPTIDAGGDAGIGEGQLFSRTVPVLDPGRYLETWEVTVDWADGSEDVTMHDHDHRDVLLEHTYDDDGVYLVTVTVENTLEPEEDEYTDTFTITVGNVGPQNVSAGQDQMVSEGDPVNLTASFDDPGGDDGPFTFLWEVTSDNGQAVPDGHDSTFSFIPNDEGTYTVDLTVTDKDGGFGTDTVIITSENVAPTITEMVGDQLLEEGETGNYAAAAYDPGDDDLTFYWDFDDGTPVVQGTVVSHQFTASDTYQVQLMVRDGDGGQDIEYLTVVVENVAPKDVYAGDDRTVTEGQLVELTATFTDPGGEGDGPFTYTWEVTATNGQAIPGGDRVDFSFTPEDDGIYYVDLTVRDADEDAGSAQVVITVVNAAPVLTGLQEDMPTTEGALLTVPNIAWFTDAGSGPGETFTFAIDWGDGTAPDTGVPTIVKTQGTFDGAHEYADDGRYTVTVTVEDDDGGAVGGSFTVTVDNVDPQAQFNGPEVGNILEPVVCTGQTWDFPGDDLHATVDWGDGVKVPVILEPDKDQPRYFHFTARHFYRAAGVYDVTLTVIDRDGGVATKGFTVHVGPPAVVAVERNGGLPTPYE